MRVAAYVTAVTRNRRPVLTRPEVVEIILEEVEFYRAKYGFQFCGFVVMPDHWHFLFIADEEDVSRVLRDMKSMIARLVVDRWKADAEGRALLEQFRLPEGGKRGHEFALWQEGSWTVLLEEPEHIERRLDYMHANPVRAGLVERAIDWPWSSYRWYDAREPVGATIDMEWAMDL